MKGPCDPENGTARALWRKKDRFSVQQPYPQVQIGGKGHPEKVGDLEPGGDPVHLAEGEEHP